VSSALSIRSFSQVLRSSKFNASRCRFRKKPTSTFDPIPWQAHFSLSLFLSSSDSTIIHHVYLTPPTLPGPLFVLHHGAGSSGLSFALLATSIRQLLPSAGVLALDCRGHGLTTTTGANYNNTLDLSLSTLSSDLYNVLTLTAADQHWPTLPPLVLIGHSLGGAVIVDLAHSSRLSPSILLGYAVLDVVEGSAMDALQSMHTYLCTRPTGFASLQQGIEWHTRSRTLRNPESARISVPGLLIEDNPSSSNPHPTTPANPTSGSQSQSAKPPHLRWKWRTDLASTQPYWQNWFIGLSKKFLESKGGKLLILAGTDRLDKELMIGQMQGKYQLLVLPDVGHFLHEDSPGKIAASVSLFFLFWYWFGRLLFKVIF
jgi:protein phosphatase methylesterase 1